MRGERLVLQGLTHPSNRRSVGGDGYLISTPFQRISRRRINEVCEGLVPALQRRGLMRTEYARSTLRGTLLEF
jgi:hypothetical protein